MSWSPRIVVFQCQFCLHSEADQHWMDTQLPENIKLVRVPCTGRISPLFVLNAVQGGADGVMISGCLPEKCHYKEGNLGARRQLDEFVRFLNHLGVEPERLRFAWINLDERGSIQRELADLEEQITAIGPARRLVTRTPSVTGATP